MARKRPETKMSKIARMLIEEYQPQSAEDIQEAIKDLLGNTLETMLKKELDEHLDYEYGDTPLSLNTRNGISKKTVKSSSGEIELDVPRDRDGSFFGLIEGMVNKITNKILPTIEEWQNRPLERVYPIVFLDAIHYNVRENALIKKRQYISHLATIRNDLKKY